MDEKPATDLLGDPLRDLPDPRGRKKHRVTPENRLKVSVLRAAGQTIAEIAEALGISAPTLRNYYFSELNQGVAAERARAVMWLRESAAAGNVSAQKAYLALLAAGNTLPKVEEMSERPDKLGKKEALREAAQSGHAGTGWDSLVQH